MSVLDFHNAFSSAVTVVHSGPGYPIRADTYFIYDEGTDVKMELEPEKEYIITNKRAPKYIRYRTYKGTKKRFVRRNEHSIDKAWSLPKTDTTKNRLFIDIERSEHDDKEITLVSMLYVPKGYKMGDNLYVQNYPGVLYCYLAPIDDEHHFVVMFTKNIVKKPKWERRELTDFVFTDKLLSLLDLTDVEIFVSEITTTKEG